MFSDNWELSENAGGRSAEEGVLSVSFPTTGSCQKTGMGGLLKGGERKFSDNRSCRKTGEADCLKKRVEREFCKFFWKTFFKCEKCFHTFIYC